MIDLCLDASDLLNDSPANRFNESESQKLCDEPLQQAVTKLYDPSNVFDGVSNDENRNSQVQPSDVQILKNKKVLLRPAASPPPPHIHTAFLTAIRQFSHGVSIRALSCLRSDIQFSVGPTVRTQTSFIESSQ